MESGGRVCEEVIEMFLMEFSLESRLEVKEGGESVWRVEGECVRGS